MKKLLPILIIALILHLFSSEADAQFVDFGKNKVQYNDFDWYVLYTEHFQIYYYKEEKELAETGAFFAEESYKILQQKFRHSMSDTIPLIFYSNPSHFKETNTTPGLIPEGVGGFFEFIKGRVVIPFDGSLSNFRHVIRHELVHVFMTSKVIAIQRNHGKISDNLPDLWFVEGLAEYWSTEWDSQAEMVVKDAVLNGYFPMLTEWYNIYGTYLMYKFGQIFLYYVSKIYGEDMILEILENFWTDDNFENVIEYTLRKSIKEISNDFLNFVRRKYFPSIKDNLAPSESGINVFSDGFGHKPCYFRNGNRDEIYFIGNKSGYTSIYRINMNRPNDAELIVEGESSDVYEEFQFFRTGLDISEKGIMAFETKSGKSDAIHLYDLKKNEEIFSYSFKDIPGINAPSWNKEGNTLVFSANDFSGKCDLYIFNTENQQLKRLTNDFNDDRDPDFSPDGNSIVFSSDRASDTKDGRYNIFIYDLKTNRIRQITSGNQEDQSPVYSSDGNRILYTSNSRGPQNIMLIDSSGSSSPVIYKLTDFTTAAFDARWCDNDSYVFSCYENGMITVRMNDGIQKKIDSIKSKKYSVITEDRSEYQPPVLKSINRKNRLKYEKRYTFDIATTAFVTDPVFGTFAGGLLAVSDLLSNEIYNILVYNNSSQGVDFWKSFNVAISKISLEHRINYAYGVYHLSGKRYDLRESDYAYYERLFGGFVSVSYPISFFKRLDFNTSLSQSDKDIDFLNQKRGLLLSNSISYVHDNSLWYYTGPIDGERFNFTLGYTTDIENSSQQYFSIMADMRKYFRLSRPVALAVRGQLFINKGKSPRRYFMGGSWSLRGWPLNTFRGSKFWQFNTELRFPLLDNVKLRFPFDMDWDFPGIRGALYFDAGNCWDNADNYVETRGSIGGGIRFNLFGIIVLRYDLGKRIEQGFKKLQGGLYHQFFFGWDF